MGTDNVNTEESYGSNLRHSWCFTLNNPTDDDKNMIKEGYYDKKSGRSPAGTKATNRSLFTAHKICHLSYGEEVGSSGTPHLQGIIVFSSRVALKRVKLFLPRAHLEPMRGTYREAKDYCRKGKLLQGNDSMVYKQVSYYTKADLSALNVLDNAPRVAYKQTAEKYSARLERTETLLQELLEKLISIEKRLDL